MNLESVPDRSAEEVRLLVEAEVLKIVSDSLVQGLRTFLIEPRLEMRRWEWADPLVHYPAWVIAESSRYDYGITFSDYGFAPERAWGLVFLSHRGFGADYCWYPTLEDAYKESRLIEEYEETKAESPPPNAT